jgi:solute carrier family 38 (sodium-coupled neutral amino acid transporter), member 2
MDEERPPSVTRAVANDDDDGLIEPLLQSPSASAPSSPQHFTTPILEYGGTGISGSIVLLAKAIIGAGSAALPLAFARLGVVFSVSFLLLVGFMTHFSLEALTLGVVASEKPSYPAAVRHLLGPSAGAFLELCLVLRCAGLMVVYIVISADLLAGSKALPGILCEVFGSLDSMFSNINPGWCSDRYLIAGILSILVLIPLVTPKKLSSATWASIAGLTSVVLWTIVTAVVAIIATVKEISFTPSWLPDSEALGGGSFTSQTIVALATLPVIATAYTCQMTVAFIIGELRNFTSNRMAVVSAAAVSLCSAVFLVVGIGSITAFGDQIPADILELFSKSALNSIVGATAGKILGISVRLGFMISILANMPLQMLPYRQSLARLILGGDQELAGVGYYMVTYGSLVAFYYIAMAATSIWVPIQLVGATAGAAIAFFYPAMVALAVVKTWEDVSRDTGGRASAAAVVGGQNEALHMAAAPTAWDNINTNFMYWRLNAWILIVIGAVQVVTGISAVLLNLGGQ